MHAAQVETAALELVVHGMSIATNAVIERKVPRCALLIARQWRSADTLLNFHQPGVIFLAENDRVSFVRIL